MKILIIGLDGMSPELLLSDEHLDNFQRLMEFGCYGRVALFPPSPTIPAVHYMATSQTPDSYQAEGDAMPVWEYLSTLGKNSVAIGLPQISSREILVYPDTLRKEGLATEWLDVDPGTNQAALQDAVFEASRRQFSLAKQRIAESGWDYFHFAIAGLVKLGKGSDGDAPAGSSGESLISEYHRYVNDELGEIFALLDEDTAVMLLSTVAARAASNDASGGYFILAAANNPLQGEVAGAGLLDIAPTLLELSGVPVPEYMQGESLFQITAVSETDPGDLSAEEEDLLRERLSGLGYIS